jgi:TRAP-type C4-dicarboxylate transport system permease small subunit
MKNAIHRCSAFLDKICAVITGFILIALCLITDYSVVMRFIFNNPLKWSYELMLVGLSWATFIGMPMTFHKQEHMRLTFVTDKLKPSVWRVYMTVIDVLLIVFLVVGVVNSIQVVKNAWPQVYQTIPVSRGIFYLSFPIGAAISVVHLVDIVLHRTAGDAPAANHEEVTA